jgi:hypothetical protein
VFHRQIRHFENLLSDRYSVNHGEQRAAAVSLTRFGNAVSFRASHTEDRSGSSCPQAGPLPDFTIMTSKEDKPAQKQNREDSEVSVSINLGLPVRVSGGAMEYYLVSKERIENLRIGTDLGETRTYGFSVGVCLTIIGVLISHYLSRQPATKLIPFLWSALFAFTALAVYLYRKDKKIKAKRESDFSEILTATKTITTPHVPMSESKTPEPSEKNFLRAQIARQRNAH